MFDAIDVNDAMPAKVFILPGWFNSDDAHWQSRWEEIYGYRRVEQQDWCEPNREQWLAALEQAIAAHDGRCVLVAHSLGCILTAHWAAGSALASRVRGALLVAPPDVTRADAPQALHGFRPIPRNSLPFPSIAVISSNDPYAGHAWSQALARDWGARCVEIGARGHINGESGLGDWPEGHALIRPWLGSMRTRQAAA